MRASLRARTSRTARAAAWRAIFATGGDFGRDWHALRLFFADTVEGLLYDTARCVIDAVRGDRSVWRLGRCQTFLEASADTIQASCSGSTAARAHLAVPSDTACNTCILDPAASYRIGFALGGGQAMPGGSLACSTFTEALNSRIQRVTSSTSDQNGSTHGHNSILLAQLHTERSTARHTPAHTPYTGRGAHTIMGHRAAAGARSRCGERGRASRATPAPSGLAVQLARRVMAVQMAGRVRGVAPLTIGDSGVPCHVCSLILRVLKRRAIAPCGSAG